MLFNLYQSTKLESHKSIMAYDPNQEDGTYGLNGVPFAISDNTIYKAVVPSISKGAIPLLNPSQWEKFSSGGGTSEVTIYTLSALTVDDTYKGSLVILNPPTNTNIALPNTVKDKFTITIRNVSSNTITVTSNVPLDGGNNAIIIKEGEIYTLVYSTTLGWYVMMKEVLAVIGQVSHFIGFYMQGTSLMMDLVALVGTNNIDTSKYNLQFTDGSPSWKIVDGAINVTYVQEILIQLEDI